ncbi:subtilase family protein [Anaerobacterium chartisolvens]|uniref:Subtilase family protein n=1 Tax=Anaerobacterium chartisolvens TaxID=1297424 RepID=A0A369AGK2_9FIRM|nr:S8 family peptidase [Anaerobacterium chartisolvens]RCX08301.1 subtilase family protein [Anaerobacterium chartisolvens]
MKRKVLLGLVLLIALMTFWFLFFFWNGTNVHEKTINTEALKSEQIIPWGTSKINAPAFWSETTGRGIKVAVMDSGINFKHPDYGENIKNGFNAVTPGEPALDNFSHGSLIAGIIAACNNEIGIVGVSPDVELYPVKVLDKYGEGDIADIVKGIDWCIENKIQIINMSFAIPDNKPFLEIAIKKALDEGIIIVASASNTYGGEVGYPASYDKVISVTAVDEKYKIARNAPRGKIDFCAPGVNVVSTSSNGGYEVYSGTSMAAPHVTGLIALILQNPSKFGLPNSRNVSHGEIYSILKELSKDLGDKGKDSTYGEGFISLKIN